MRARGKYLAKFPIKNEGGRFGSLCHPAKLWGNVTASVEIMPQILATKKRQAQLYHALTLAVHLSPPPPPTPTPGHTVLLGGTRNPPSSSPSFCPWCLLPTALPPLITAPKSYNICWSLQPQQLARKLKGKLILV